MLWRYTSSKVNLAFKRPFELSLKLTDKHHLIIYKCFESFKHLWYSKTTCKSTTMSKIIVSN